MAATSYRTARQPKLRSSCDGCGASKVKCDRGLPECGRCLSLGLVCVYGISRKTGKPPREKLQIPEAPNKPRTPREHASRSERARAEASSKRNDTGATANRGNILSSAPFLNSVSTTWGPVDRYLDSLITNHDAPDPLHNEQVGLPRADSSSLDFSEWVLKNDFSDDFLPATLDAGPVSTLESPELEGYPTPATQTTTSHIKVDENMYFDNLLVPLLDSEGHNCFREAYDIIGILSFRDQHRSHSTVPPASQASASASTTSDSTHPMPFDQILRLNRDSSERLGRLLTCSCTGRPHLALLYASIISRILMWYQQAAGCTRKDSWGHGSSTPDAGLPNVSPSWPLAGTPSSWSSTTASTVNTGGASTPILNRPGALAETLTPMAIGSFNIDDQRVQTALKIQLLLGEIRRTGSLIDHFATRGSSGVDESISGCVDSLYKSLGSWLRGEHSRIVDIMRARLREVST